MKTSKKQTYPPNHFMGKYTGYSLKDGKYHIAPTYTERFDKLLDEQSGLNALVEAVNNHVKKEYADIATQRRKLWDAIREDLSLDPKKEWTYNYYLGEVTEILPKEAT